MQCYVVTAKVIKCILLSRFPKAVLTQRQLLFFHNISILLMNMHIRPIKAPLIQSRREKQADKEHMVHVPRFWGEGEFRE